MGCGACWLSAELALIMPREPVDLSAVCAFFHDFKPFFRLQIAFAPKPFFHCALQPLERNAVSGLQNPVVSRKSVIENRIVREIPHGEVVDLVDRAGVALACGVDSVHTQSPRKHGSTLERRAKSSEGRAIRRKPAKQLARQQTASIG